MVTPPPPALLHLSLVLGGALRDEAGDRLGRVDDLIVRLGQDAYPPVTGLLASVAGRDLFVSADHVSELREGESRLRGAKFDLRRFERRPQEVLLRKDVLDRQLINVDGARLVRANEIELARVDGWYRVVGVDTGPRGALRRLLPRAFAHAVGPGAFLDWACVEPFTGHVPTLRLRVPHPRLARLHPAEIADLVEAASHAEGEEIIAAVGSDAELEADVFEELEPRHRVEFLRDRSDAEAAALLARMEADDAADLVGELPEERREGVVALLPAVQRRRVRALVGFDPATAGGLMSPDFVCLYGQATAADALERVRSSHAPSEALAAVYVVNTSRRLVGSIALLDLLRAEPDTRLRDLARPEPRRIDPATSLDELARVMSDFDLAVVPVVDDEGRVSGVVTVDDVLDAVVPAGRRRRLGVLVGG
jgi:CBS domain-containing protein